MAGFLDLISRQTALQYLLQCTGAIADSKFRAASNTRPSSLTASCTIHIESLRSNMLQVAFSRSTHLAALSTTWRLYHASVLPSLVSTTSPEFQHKAQCMDVLVSDLRLKIAHAKEGGGPKARERMRSKGKRLPRERLVSLPGRQHVFTLV